MKLNAQLKQKAEGLLPASACSAVEAYERESGLSALNFRQLPKRASRRAREEALRLDLHWWELHAQEVGNRLKDAIRQNGARELPATGGSRQPKTL